MRKLALSLTALCALTFSGCIVGPHQLARTVDDWDREMYVKSPWLDAALNIFFVMPIARFGASIGDFFVTDAYTFWVKDAFGDGTGTGFRHADVPASRSMGSLIGDGKFLEITGG